MNHRALPFADREFLSPYSYDATDTLRLIANQVSFNGLVNDAFHQIHQHGRTDVAIAICLLEVIAEIAEHTHNHDTRMTLLRHADMIQTR